MASRANPGQPAELAPPGPPRGRRLRDSRSLGALQERNFRLFLSGQLVSLIGTWMQATGQDWLVLTLGGKGGALGAVVALQFTPVLLLTLYAGVLADRVGKRRLFLATQVGFAVLAGVLGLLTVTGQATLPLLFVMAFLFGVAQAVEIPVRQAFVAEMVPAPRLANAVALHSVTFNSARIVGPAVAGLLITRFGAGPTFVANALSYLAVIAALAAMRPADLRPTPRIARSAGQVRDGLRYVRATPVLLLPIGLMAVVGTFGMNFPITLALMAKREFAGTAALYGTFSAALAVGALLGALAATRRVRPRLPLLLASGAAFGGLELLAGLAPDRISFGLLLVPLGAAVLTLTTGAVATVQLEAEEALRGRVMALYALVFLGTTPIGAPLIGLLCQRYGARAGLVIGGAVCLLGAGGAAAAARRAGRAPARPAGT